MKITFEDVSKIEVIKNEKGRNNFKMICPVEGPYGGEVEFSLNSCDIEFTDDGLVIKKIYDER